MEPRAKTPKNSGTTMRFKRYAKLDTTYEVLGDEDPPEGKLQETVWIDPMDLNI